MIRFLIAVCLSTGLSAEERPCLSPTSDYILAKDLARTIPQFAVVPAGKVLAPAPAVGGKRIFRLEEIRSFAAQSGTRVELNADPENDVCFAWPLEPLNKNEVLDALRKSLNSPDGNSAANVEITDLTADRVPRGQLNFPLSGLGTPASLDQPVPVPWRGEVAYTDTKRLPVWVRVRVVAPVTVIVAADRLERGHPVSATQLRTGIVQRFPSLKNKLTSIDQLVGLIPDRTFSPGAELRVENFSKPNEVNRGDLVAIEVHSGSVKLAFSGRAETAGHTGDLIAVRNPDTQKIFQARVCAKDRAFVESGTVQGN